MRNLTTFDSGNRAGLKLTPELHRQFVTIVAQTGRISVASGKCGLGVSTARHWMSRGRNEESGPYREFLDDVERARSDFLLLANQQLNKMAIGGLIRMPAFDKSGSPIRNHREGCDMEPGCGCELVFVEKVVMPDSRILMWQVDRIDPLPNGDAAGGDVPMAPELTSAEQIAEASKYFDLFRQGIQVLIDLGCPPAELLTPRAQTAIETTSSPAPAEAANVEVASSSTSEPATPTEPPKSDPEPL
jgi:hypothetical protein